MLLATCIVFASAVLRAQLLQCPTRQFQFVNIGDKAKICCNYAAKTELPGHLASWHKRKEDEVPVLVNSCRENKTVGRYVCRGEGQMLTLEIEDAQVTDSGQYLCAKRDRDIYLGSSLIVGDSYTPSTRVTLLQPPAGEPPALLQRHSPLACLVQGVSNLVQVSWHTPEGLQQGSRTLLVKNSSSSLTFLKLLHIPPNMLLSGGSVTCEVRFNASGSSVKRSSWLPAAPSAEDCASYVVSLTVAGLLLLLLLLLSLVWKPCCLSRPGDPPGPPDLIRGPSAWAPSRRLQMHHRKNCAMPSWISIEGSGQEQDAHSPEQLHEGFSDWLTTVRPLDRRGREPGRRPSTGSMVPSSQAPSSAWAPLPLCGPAVNLGGLR